MRLRAKGPALPVKPLDDKSQLNNDVSCISSQMRYDVKLSPSELELLGSLIGQPLDRVSTDGWAAEFRTGPTLISVAPEEIAIPDAEHPYGDVDRPLIRVDADQVHPDMPDLLGKDFGLIRAVNVVSTLISFSPVVDWGPWEILPGVTLPPSQGYGHVYFPPERKADAEREVGAGALIDLDTAIELVTDGCPSVVFYTRGYFILTSTEGLPPAEDWVRLELYSRRAAK